MLPVDFAACGAAHTAEEIRQQPQLWREVWRQLEQRKDTISAFLQQAPQTKIVFTGAGTSEFVGNTVVPYLRQLGQQRLHSISSTDLVLAPEAYLHRQDEVLLVSCARSGDSPESLGAAKLVQQLAGRCSHLLLTCNPQGTLAQQFGDQKNALVFEMPAANDQGFAMTGSFTSMCLAGALIFGLERLAALGPGFMRWTEAADDFLLRVEPVMRQLTALGKKRLICLGSAENKGIAQEAHLKVLELSASQNTASFDSPLGFRHGPKSVMNADSLVLFFGTNDPYIRRYELDMLRELKSTPGEHYIMALTPVAFPDPEALCHQQILLPEAAISSNAQENRLFDSLSHILAAQLYAMHNSIVLGVRPDNPSPSGSVNRVVQGVTIYPYAASAS